MRWRVYLHRPDRRRRSLGAFSAAGAVEAIEAARLKVKRPRPGDCYEAALKPPPKPRPPRRQWGSSNRIKLDTERVQVIRDKAEAGVDLERMARRYGVGLRAIQDVVERRTWAHV